MFSSLIVMFFFPVHSCIKLRLTVRSKNPLHGLNKKEDREGGREILNVCFQKEFLCLNRLPDLTLERER